MPPRIVAVLDHPLERDQNDEQLADLQGLRLHHDSRLRNHRDGDQ